MPRDLWPKKKEDSFKELHNFQKMFTVGAILDSKNQGFERPRTKKTEPKKWMGKTPEKCDLCEQQLDRWFVDSRTIRGYWALMCMGCFKEWGIGLGLGKGQMYNLETLSKVEG